MAKVALLLSEWHIAAWSAPGYVNSVTETTFNSGKASALLPGPGHSLALSLNYISSGLVFELPGASE